MKCKIVISITIILLMTLTINAQVNNVNKSSLNIGLTGTIQTGNSERVLLISSLKYEWNHKNGNIQFTTSDRYIYGTVGDFNKENDILSANYLIFNNKSRWNPLVGLFYEELKIKGINSFVKPMLGVQYKLIEKSKLEIRPQVLLGYSWKEYRSNVFENFNNSGDNQINGTNVNFAVNAKLKAFENKVTFTLFSIYQLGIEETKDKRFWFDLNAQIPIWKGLYGRISFNNNYENIILENTKNTDVNISYGVGLKL